MSWLTVWYNSLGVYTNMTEEKKLLLLFDGNALVHRGYHALPPLTLTKTGEPVNAVYGFASMVIFTHDAFIYKCVHMFRNGSPSQGS